MASLPQVIPTLSSPSVSSYSFIEVATGTGYLELYGGKTNTDNLLSSITFYSDPNETHYGSIGLVSNSKIVDDDFDVEIQKPMTLSGTGIVSVTVRNYAANGAGDVTTYLTAKLRKWDGATETEIANGTSGTYQFAAADYGFSILTANMDIPLTHFKIGETLRLTIEIYATATGNSGCGVGYAHDPKNTTWTTGSSTAPQTQMLVQLPVRVVL